MARVAGHKLYQGTVHNVTICCNGVVRAKSSLTAERVGRDPAFKRTRENAAEFGMSARHTKLIIEALRSIVPFKERKRFTNLKSKVQEVVKTDLVSERGQRHMGNGQQYVLEDHELHPYSNLSAVLGTEYRCAIDASTGTFNLEVPAFHPLHCLNKAYGATHFQLFLKGASLDFFDNKAESATAVSQVMEISPQLNPGVSLSCSVAVSNNSLYAAVGVIFYQETNGEYYPLYDQAHVPLRIVRIEQGQRPVVAGVGDFGNEVMLTQPDVQAKVDLGLEKDFAVDEVLRKGMENSVGAVVKVGLRSEEPRLQRMLDKREGLELFSFMKGIGGRVKKSAKIGVG